MRGRRRVVTVALAALVSTAGCADQLGTLGPFAPQATAAAGVAPAPAPAGSAAAALAALPVKGRAPMTGYTRAQFGQAWADVDRDGCDQRNQVLERDLTGVAFKPGTHNCVVLSGTLADAYTGRAVVFRRGATTSGAVQIDHMVALGDAWQTGAQALAATTRARLANDPLNLQAVEGPVNQAKGDSDAASWLPPATGYRCTYVARQVAVKTTYRLWVTAAERDAIAGVLRRCPGQALPVSALR